jgi:hypothetical protein
MTPLPVTRFVLAFIAGFFVASNLNWAVAELLLNPSRASRASCAPTRAVPTSRA